MADLGQRSDVGRRGAIGPEPAGGKDLARSALAPALARAFEAPMEHAVHGALHRRTGHGVALLPQGAVVHAMLMRGNVAAEIRHRLVREAGRGT
jgi:hypothetical protein